MALSQKSLGQLSLKPPAHSELSAYEKPEVIYPFSDVSTKGDIEFIIPKILLVNFYEKTQVKDKNIEDLAKHIDRVMAEENWDVLRSGDLSEDYFLIAEQIAQGHGIKSNQNNPSEDTMTSFASKFCGHHNQKAPFYDKYVWEILKYWVKGTGFKMEWHNYRNYVEAFWHLQECHPYLKSFSLRHIESYIWSVANDIVKEHP